MNSNLYRLLTGGWYIQENYGLGYLPQAINILNGNSQFVPGEEIPEEEFVLLQKSNLSSHQVSASNFNETENKTDYVLVVELKSPIYKYNQECGPRGTKHKMKLMTRYENDPNCKGVVLDIDSGGGQVDGTSEFFDFIQSYSKPVVAYSDGTLCSAAYYIAAGSSHIVLNKRASAIGCIGTMIYFIDTSGILEKKGAKIVKEYATKSTDKNKHFEQLLAGKPESYIKNVLDPLTEQFHTDMKAARPNLDQKVLAGDDYFAEEAVTLGLADELGTLDTAIKKVFELSQAKSKNSNLNNSSQMENLPNIQSILGLDGPFASNENGTYLNEEQLQTLEKHIQGQKDDLAKEKTNHQNTQDNLDTSIEESTEVTGAIEKALEDAEVEGRDKMSGVEGVQALSGLIAEYGKGDGDEHTKPIDGGKGENGDSNPNMVGGIDISDAMDN